MEVHEKGAQVGRLVSRYDEWNQDIRAILHEARLAHGRSGTDLTPQCEAVIRARDRMQLAIDALWDAPATASWSALRSDVDAAELGLAESFGVLRRRIGDVTAEGTSTSD